MGSFRPRRIAVIVTRQIGDVLLTTPLMAAARRRWPDATLDVFGFAGTLGMLAGNADVSHCVEMPIRFDAARALAFLAHHGRRYDLAFVAEASDRAHLLAFGLARLRSGVVPAEASHAWWKNLLLCHAVETVGDRGDRHIADEKLALIAPWLEEAPTAGVVPPMGRALPPDLEAALAGAAQVVVVHAPSMWPYKQWPVERYAEVTKALLDDGHCLVLTGSGAPRDLGIAAAVVAGIAGGADTVSPRLIDAVDRLDFQQLAALLARAALYIGPDGSVTHLAAACGAPVIAMFGPTDPRRWGPLPPAAASGGVAPRFVRIDVLPQRIGPVVLLQGAGAGTCVPCGRAGCDDHRQSRSACLEAIGADRVLVEARAVLSGPSRAAARRGAGAQAGRRPDEGGLRSRRARPASTTAPEPMSLTSPVGDSSTSPS